MSHPLDERGKVDYDAFYRGAPPWEIGAPQPALAEALARETLGARVLDAGCGTGEVALLLAARGHRVTGVDLSAVAIGRAGQKAEGRGLAATFRVADATTLDFPDASFDGVVDSGLLHSLDAAERPAYVAGLRRVCAPGATILILTISPEAGTGWGIAEAELRDAFDPAGWRDIAVAPAEVRARVGGRDFAMPGLLMRARRRAD